MCEGDNKSLGYIGTGVVLKKHMEDHDESTKEKKKRRKTERKLWHMYSSM